MKTFNQDIDYTDESDDSTSSKEELPKDLKKAVKEGKIEHIRAYFSAAATNSKTVLSFAEKCLFLAANNGHIRIMEWLLEYNSGLGQCGETLLATGAHVGNYNLVEFALTSPLLRLEEITRYPLMVALYGGHTEIAKLLLQDKRLQLTDDPPPSTSPPVAEIILCAAAERGNVEIMKLLLSSCSPININVALYGNEALHTAVNKGHTRIVELLLNHPELKIGESEFRYPLVFTAARKGYLEVVKLLLNDSRTSNQVIEELYGQRILLGEAIQGGHLPVVKELLCRSGEVRYQGWSPLVDLEIKRELTLTYIAQQICKVIQTDNDNLQNLHFSWPDLRNKSCYTYMRRKDNYISLKDKKVYLELNDEDIDILQEINANISLEQFFGSECVMAQFKLALKMGQISLDQLLSFFDAVEGTYPLIERFKKEIQEEKSAIVECRERLESIVFIDGEYLQAPMSKKEFYEFYKQFDEEVLHPLDTETGKQRLIDMHEKGTFLPFVIAYLSSYEEEKRGIIYDLDKLSYLLTPEEKQFFEAIVGPIHAPLDSTPMDVPTQIGLFSSAAAAAIDTTHLSALETAPPPSLDNEEI
jgi:ankyrin repeat protein